MKKLITLALVLASTSAFATRARVTALGNAAHLSDVTTVYARPTDMLGLADSLTIESGKTYSAAGIPSAIGTTSADGGAEGLMIRSMGDSKMVLSLGHADSTIFAQRNEASASVAAIRQQNPLMIGYGMKSGDLNFAGSLIYSNFENKLAGSEQKESSMGILLGASSTGWNATLALVLADKWEAGTGAALDEYKGKSGVNLSGTYQLADDTVLAASVVTGGYKTTDATVDETDVTNMNIGVNVVTSMKKDGTEVFYGAGLTSSSHKDAQTILTTDDVETSGMHMPLIIGFEADANSWLTLRGSVTQNLLLVDTSKTTTGTTTTVETSPGANSTTFAAGAGLKFNKLVLDGGLMKTAAGNQTINGTDVLANVGMTYNF